MTPEQRMMMHDQDIEGALASPAPSWRDGCEIAIEKDRKWSVYSPGRTHWLGYEQKRPRWFEEAGRPIGIWKSVAEAESFLTIAPPPPGYIDPASPSSHDQPIQNDPEPFDPMTGPMPTGSLETNLYRELSRANDELIASKDRIITDLTATNKLLRQRIDAQDVLIRQMAELYITSKSDRRKFLIGMGLEEAPGPLSKAEVDARRHAESKSECGIEDAIDVRCRKDGR